MTLNLNIKMGDCLSVSWGEMVGQLAAIAWALLPSLHKLYCGVSYCHGLDFLHHFVSRWPFDLQKG